MHTRLRTDFQLTLLVLFAAIGVIGIAPFAVYRFAQGRVFIGLVDIGTVAVFALGALYAWRTGRTARVALLLATTSSLGCVLAGALTGTFNLMWTAPALLANFLLLRRAHAAMLSTLVVVAVLFTNAALAGIFAKSLFVLTSLIVCLFSYVFSWRAEAQRSQLEAVAAQDPLTGAHNRRNMLAELKTAMAASTREGTPLGLLVLDLDHFKAINDSQGHEAGDEVLVRMSALVRGGTRKADRFFRLGGEEFGLLVPDADAMTLLSIAEKLRTSVEREIRCGDQPVTVSIGAAAYRPGESAGSWLRRADLAMYRAKHDGRNCCVLDDGDTAAAGTASAAGSGTDDEREASTAG